MAETQTARENAGSEELLRATVAALDALAASAMLAESAPGVLDILGKATHVSRVHLYENLATEGEGLFMHPHSSWSASQAGAGSDDDSEPERVYEDGFTWLAERMSRGEIVCGPVASFLPAGAPLPVGEDVRSAAFVPVFAGSDWWGFLRYDDCLEERDWSFTEIEAIRVFASIFGNAIHRELLDAERRQAQAWLETHLANIPAVTYIEFTDPDHQLGYDEAYVSPQIFDMFGYSTEEWLRDEDDPLWLGSDYIHEDDREETVRHAAETAESGEPYRAEYRMRHGQTGEFVWVRDEAHLVEGTDEIQPYWHGLIVDITERKAMEEQIAFLAYHDALTGLANRKLFMEMLEPALARAVRNDYSVAVLFMDLDNFKQINDTLGHDMGDLLLQQVSARLNEATRETDLVARQGGDEFLVMIPDIEAGQGADELDSRERALRVAEMMAERIHKAMRLPFALGDTEVNTSMSIGISVFPFDATDVRSLLKNSDAAMYQSKRNRSGGYEVFAQTGKDPMVDYTLTNRLRKAVKDQPWVLQYQPMVSLEERSVIGVEALLRWRKPKGDLVSADQFVPLAEEMGLLEIIGEWVLEELARQMTAWKGQGLDLDVSFNLSPRQLWQRDLVSKLVTVFDASGIDHSRVMVEVSESTATTDPARSQRVLRSIHEQGFKLAIDDFGTGYTSPARLKHVPIDILKIDHPLTRDLPDDDEVGGFVEAVIHFAENLGIVTLAEGIEIEPQREFLMSKGCKLGQGYLFSRPVNGDDVAGLLL